MNDHTTLAPALWRIVWAHAFIIFSINLGTLDILPAWVGYLMVAGTLAALAAERPHAATLRPMAYILAALSGLAWLGKAVGMDMPYLIKLVQQIVMLIFLFSLLSELAELGKNYGWPSFKGLLVIRNVYVVLSVAVWIVTWLEGETLALIVAVCGFINILFLWMYLFNLSKYFRYKT